MSDRDEKKQNKDDLAEIRSLIGDTDTGGFSLEDILAEYGSGKFPGRGAVPVPPKKEREPEGPDLPWPEAPRTSRCEGKVVAFPGGQVQQPPDEEELPPDEASLPSEEPEEQLDGPAADKEVIPFPEEESVLSAFLKDLGKKADDYADHMFEEDEAIDHSEVRRLEKLIPGTDREEEPEEVPRSRRPRPQDPPPPDTDPQELARSYHKGLGGARLRVLAVFLLFALSLVQLLVPALGLVWLPPLDDLSIQRWIAVGLLAAGVLLAGDALVSAIGRAFHGRLGMDVLAALSCAATLADGAVLALHPSRGNQLPYSAVALAGLFFLLHGAYHKRCGLRLSCRTAAASATPYRVTLDEGKWNGLDTYTKWSGTQEGFGSQIQADDGAQRIFRRFCPLLLLGCLLLSLLTSVGIGQPEHLLWCLSATFTATSAFGGSLIYGRSFHKLARRLAQSGAALAGWPGISRSRRGDRVLITDTDLFPPGYVELNGVKVLGNFPMERVVAYTATLIRDSGSGLTKLFHDHLRALGGLMRNADHLCCYEGGGLSANIRGDQVLVGSAAFMNLMDIPLPQWLNVKSAVFCAINGELAGIFALSYSLHDTIFPALEELMREKIGPVLATRDFNLIPAMLHQRFKLAADKMDFPPVERRRELSDPEQPHSDVLTALLCREGLFPFAEAVTAAKRLRWATRLGAILCCAGSLLGLLLAAYLTSVSAYSSLSPLNLLVFMLTWLFPVWFLSGWVHRY